MHQTSDIRKQLWKISFSPDPHIAVVAWHQKKKIPKSYKHHIPEGGRKISFRGTSYKSTHCTCVNVLTLRVYDIIAKVNKRNISPLAYTEMNISTSWAWQSGACWRWHFFWRWLLLSGCPAWATNLAWPDYSLFFFLLLFFPPIFSLYLFPLTFPSIFFYYLVQLYFPTVVSSDLFVPSLPPIVSSNLFLISCSTNLFCAFLFLPPSRISGPAMWTFFFSPHLSLALLASLRVILIFVSELFNLSGFCHSLNRSSKIFDILFLVELLYLLTSRPVYCFVISSEFSKRISHDLLRRKEAVTTFNDFYWHFL